MPTQAKIDRVQALKEKIERSTITLTADYSGISVNEMTDLRRRLRDAGVEFTIVKNTLMYLAADQAQRPNVKEIVQGPTALALGYDDPLDVAKAVADYIRISRSVLSIRGAVIGDGPVMSSAEHEAFRALFGDPRPCRIKGVEGDCRPIRSSSEGLAQVLIGNDLVKSPK